MTLRAPQPAATTRFPLIRALAVTWLFSGLRSDEISRLRVGCIRWQQDGLPIPGDSKEVLAQDAVCLLDVPVHKTGTAFTSACTSTVVSHESIPTGSFDSSRWSETTSVEGAHRHQVDPEGGSLKVGRFSEQVRADSDERHHARHGASQRRRPRQRRGAHRRRPARPAPSASGARTCSSRPSLHERILPPAGAPRGQCSSAGPGWSPVVATAQPDARAGGRSTGDARARYSGSAVDSPGQRPHPCALPPT
jgi:hypothetical protein